MAVVSTVGTRVNVHIFLEFTCFVANIVAKFKLQ